MLLPSSAGRGEEGSTCDSRSESSTLLLGTPATGWATRSAGRNGDLLPRTPWTRRPNASVALSRLGSVSSRLCVRSWTTVSTRTTIPSFTSTLSLSSLASMRGTDALGNLDLAVIKMNHNFPLFFKIIELNAVGSCHVLVTGNQELVCHDDQYRRPLPPPSGLVRGNQASGKGERPGSA
jgi:hypothetical protein